MGFTSSHNILLSFPRRVNYGWWVLLVTALAGFFATGSSGWTFTVMVKPMAQAFDSSHSEVVGVLAWSGILGALLAPLAGRIVDRHGARVVITASLIILGLMTVLSSRTSALWQFYIFFQRWSGGISGRRVDGWSPGRGRELVHQKERHRIRHRRSGNGRRGSLLFDISSGDTGTGGTGVWSG